MNLARRLRTLLILGRISNLPTVWTNCLAAWLLSGGGTWSRFAILGVGASFLYTAGMFLNDAFDEAFDRRYRAERPIPSGQISTSAVWSIGWGGLLAGWLTLLTLGITASLWGALLVLCIVVYDLIHKRTALAPLLMAACRFLLYVVAASAAQGGVTAPLFWRAGALAAYITGISYLARGESAPAPARAWPVALLFAPVLLPAATSPAGSLGQWSVIAIAVAWVFWCLRGGFRQPRKPLASGVPGLLAGIALVDWVAGGVGISSVGAVFFGLFLLALALQRIAPAS